MLDTVFEVMGDVKQQQAQMCEDCEIDEDMLRAFYRYGGCEAHDATVHPRGLEAGIQDLLPHHNIRNCHTCATCTGR